MRHAYISDYCHVGANYIRHCRYLAEAAHAHLDDRRLMARIKAEKGQRHAYLIIEVTLVFEGIVFRRERRMDHILGGGLADAARYTDKRDFEKASVIAGEIEQRFAGAADKHLPLAEAAIPLAYDRARPALKSLGGVIVAVEILAFQGDEKAIRSYLPCIGANAVKAPVKLRNGVDRLCGFFIGKSFHAQPPVFSLSIFATISRSS